VVRRLGTTYDGGGGTTSPAEAKIIIGGPRTRSGWEGNVGSINNDACFDTCVSQANSRMLAAGWFLEGSLGELILAVTHSSL